jgi:SAM-dependent methyltransferase
MNPDHLPRAGALLNARKDYLAIHAPLASIAGKDVLCIGYSEAEIDEYISPHNPSAITALTLWDNHQDARVTKYPLVIGDITQRTQFVSQSFDAVLTLSLLEHMNPLQSGVDEIYRILKPGGYFFAFFGPAWSSPYGHHIYERVGDPFLDFTSWQMPAHMHLLCSPAEIMRFYVEHGYDELAGKAALHWFYDAGHINRLMYDDYIDILGQKFQFVLQELMYTPLPLSHLELLRSKFPRYHDFSTYGAKYILQALP